MFSQSLGYRWNEFLQRHLIDVLRFASHSFSLHCNYTETLSRSDDQTDQQALNHSCNLPLSASHPRIPLSMELFQSGFGSSSIQIQISRALCGGISGSGSSIANSLSVWHPASGSEATGQMEITLKWINIKTRRESYVLLHHGIGKWGSRLTCVRITLMHSEKRLLHFNNLITPAWLVEESLWPSSINI